MAYDEHLAERIRELVAEQTGGRFTEQRMFGGLAFLVAGHMAVTASREGGIMVRVEAERTAELLSRAHTRPMVMRGSELDGWVRVDPAGVTTRRALAAWVTRGVTFVQTLSPSDP